MEKPWTLPQFLYKAALHWKRDSPWEFYRTAIATWPEFDRIQREEYREYTQALRTHFHVN